MKGSFIIFAKRYYVKSLRNEKNYKFDLFIISILKRIIILSFSHSDILLSMPIIALIQVQLPLGEFMPFT
jgi:hypothetical protein